MAGILVGPPVVNYIKKYLQRTKSEESDSSGPIIKQ